jgi:hypothetical protein
MSDFDGCNGQQVGLCVGCDTCTIAALRAEVAELRERLEQRTQALHRTALNKDAAERALARVAPVPCCNYREEIDAPCDGTSWLIPGQPTYICDTCGARCGSQVHATCAALDGAT